MSTRALLFAACLIACPADAADRTIYRCVEAGVSTFSDRPCGGSIKVYSIDVPLDTAAAIESPAAVSKVARAPPRKALRPAEPKDSGISSCARLGSELRRLAARMRTGYSVAEGERLRERQRLVRARRRDLQCR